MGTLAAACFASLPAHAHYRQGTYQSSYYRPPTYRVTAVRHRPVPRSPQLRIPRVGKPFWYGDRSYGRVYSQSNVLFFVAWFAVLPSGEKQRYVVNCTRPWGKDAYALCKAGRT